MQDHLGFGTKLVVLNIFAEFICENHRCINQRRRGGRRTLGIRKTAEVREEHKGKRGEERT